MQESDITDLKIATLARIVAAKSTADLETIRVEALGKSGSVTVALKGLAELSAGMRKDQGFKLNQVKVAVSEALAARKAELEPLEMAAALAASSIDVSLPCRPESTAQGRIHPIYKVRDEIVAIFGAMGFDVAEGPDIEDDYHNFMALNFPKDHPARQMQATFFMEEKDGDGSPLLLRTQTSPMQIRTMEAQKPPIRVIVPGRTYRVDSDATHSPMFHQFEGLVIDNSTNMGHLKGTMIAFLKAFFETDDVRIRMRPSFFPFTEPSAEVDVGYSKTKDGVKVGGDENWMEIFGSGIVHPNVLRNCGIDPDEFQGYAFGGGIDRLAMLKYGMTDLRPFFASDVRWLKHYGFPPFDVPSLVGGLSNSGGVRI